MILVTLGTQDKEFVRLLKDVEKEIINKNIKDKVIVQAGNTKYKSKYMEIFDFIPMDKFSKLIEDCDILITHGGVGSIITGLKNGKKVIAVPRLKKYKEHVNDHQLQIVSNFEKNGYILAYNDGQLLNDVLKKVKKFKPKVYEGNNNKLVNILTNYIDNDKSSFHPILNLLIFLFLLFLILCIL